MYRINSLIFQISFDLYPNQNKTAGCGDYMHSKQQWEQMNFAFSVILSGVGQAMRFEPTAIDRVGL